MKVGWFSTYTLPCFVVDFCFQNSSSYLLFWNLGLIRTFCCNYREDWRHSVLGHQTAPAEGGGSVPGWSGQYTQWRPVTWYRLQLYLVLWIRIWIRIGSRFNWVPGSGSAKIIYKHRKKLINFIFWNTGCSHFRAEGFSCSLDTSKLQFLIKKDF